MLIIILGFSSSHWKFPTPINYATYYVLAHPTLQQLFKSFSYTLDIELLYLVVISVLC